MRFTLLDRITELEPGVKITAVKNLTMAEEYLADHFPQFPVMPGVLMLQAMTEAGAWLVRAYESSPRFFALIGVIGLLVLGLLLGAAVEAALSRLGLETTQADHSE